MSANEVLVFVVFLLLGYWIVSAFFLRKGAQEWPKVLNVRSDASVEEIRAAYDTLISQYHPDKLATLGAELRELAERKSREVTAAYQEALRSRGA